MKRAKRGVGARAALLVAVTALGSIASARSAYAREPRVSVALVPCDGRPVDAARFLRVLSVELASEGAVVAFDDPGATTEVFVTMRCGEGGERSDVRVVDRVTGKVATRTLDLADAQPSLLPRTLALAVSELLRASWAELALSAAVDAEPAERTTLRRSVARRLAPAVQRAAREDATATVNLRVAIAGRYFERFGHGTLGGNAGIVVVPPEVPLWLSVSLGADAARVIDALGDITVVHAFLDVGAAYHGVVAPLGFALGPFARLGPVFLEATANAPATDQGAVGFATLVGARASVGVDVGRRAAIGLDLEIALPVAPVVARAGGVDAAGIDGIATGIEVSVRLPL